MNGDIRTELIKHVNPDVCCLVETHLDCDDKCIDVPDYTTFYHNRSYKSANAKITHGGVAVLVNKSILYEYHVHVEDNSCEGYLFLVFKNKVTSTKFAIHCIYLKPENSVWNNNSDLYQALLTNIYSHSDTDRSVIVGDFNARIGKELDYIPKVDIIPDRIVLDQTLNKQGHDLLEFLHDSKHCVLNGRVGSQAHTCFKGMGNSVVDYIVTDHLNLENFSDFYCITPDEQLDIVKRDVNHKRRVSDHSILVATMSISNDYTKLSTDTCNNVEKKIYQLHRAEHGFMNNACWTNSVNTLIDSLYESANKQKSLDDFYDKLLCVINYEMEKFVLVKTIDKESGKRLRVHKPYWDLELHTTWNSYHNAKKQNSENMHALRSKFDKMLRRKERNYYRDKSFAIDTANTKDPNKFWNYIKGLGPRNHNHIPDCVKVGDEFVYNTPDVLNEWRTKYEMLYQKPDCTRQGYNKDFYDCCLRQIADLEQHFAILDSDNDTLNVPLERDEIVNALNALKDRKATGIDMIKNEILKNSGMTNIIVKLFQYCFKNKITPTKWRTGIISPIPKANMKCIYDPNNYRGLMLLCTLEKAYTSVLNARFNKYVNELIVDEQAGFRKGYSCQDQAFILSCLIHKQINKNASLFAVFIDLKKYFDWINRKLLCLKLLNIGVRGKFYGAITSIYKDTIAQVRINGNLSSTITVQDGLMQGETFSPSLASLFLNDFALSINVLSLGVPYGDMTLSILLYADDIVLFSDNEIKLQLVLNHFNTWCENWQTNYNLDKTKVMHFRPKRMQQTNYDFMLGSSNLEYVKNYKYLGMYFDEHLDFIDGVDILSQSAGRALSSIMSKLKTARGLSFNTYTKLFDSCVYPILNYFAGIWGHDEFSSAFSIVKRALRYYLCLPRYTSIASMLCISGWLPPQHYTFVEKCRLYNRILKMDDKRICKRLLLLDISTDGAGWYENFSKVCKVINVDTSPGSPINLDYFTKQSKLFFEKLLLN